jgi:hypothetical protein
MKINVEEWWVLMKNNLRGNYLNKISMHFSRTIPT